jgi:hypothetical protein
MASLPVHQAAPLIWNVLVRAQRRFAKMSLLFPGRFQKGPPAPTVKNSGKAPRVCLIFSRRARAHSGPNAPKEPTTLAP